MLAPLYQRPPGAEIPAMGFAVGLKSLVKANLLSEGSGLMMGSIPANFNDAALDSVIAWR
jgi:hypothetical protein